MNQKEIYQALSDGETIQQTHSDGNLYLYKFINDKVHCLHSGQTIWRLCDISFHYTVCDNYSIYKEPVWTDNLPCLCWVWDNDDTSERYIGLVTNFDPSDNESYYVIDGNWYKYAEPITDDDYNKYKAKPVNATSDEFK